MSIFSINPSKRTVTDEHPLRPIDTESFLPLGASRVGPSYYRFPQSKIFTPSRTTPFSNESSSTSSTEMIEFSQDAFLSKNDMFKNLTEAPMDSEDSFLSYSRSDNQFINSFVTPAPSRPPSPASEAINYVNPKSPPQYNTLQFQAEDATVASETSEVAGAASALDFAPGLIGSSIINETTNAANQQRNQSAQISPNFDARTLASMQNSQQTQIAGIGSTATIVASGIGATLGSSLGPAGSIAGSVLGAAAGVGATMLAQNYSSVNPNIISGVSGGMTSADDSV